MSAGREPPLPTHPATRAQPQAFGRPLRWFCALCLLCAFAHVVRRGFDVPGAWRNAALLASVLVTPALACAWLAQLAWRSRLPELLRWILSLSLVYHALFGPALLLALAIEPVTRNDDFVLRLWPHVVRAINSLE
jgi:hypothetical protein